MMKARETIEKLRNLKRSKVVWADGHEIIDTAISALEKQVPKEPVNRIELKDFDQKIYAYRGDCPVCGKDGIISLNARYCPDCGQAVDWSVTEE